MTFRKNNRQEYTSYEIFPPIKPFFTEILSTKDGHYIYFEQCGNPQGIPVIVLHGGPGAGCNPNMRRYFDPSYYRIILFDQRGCGRSKPHASVINNTTWHLVDDIEQIRIRLDVEKFFIFGGSWGSALGLIYAQKFPNHVLGLILRGLFTMTQKELDWFYSEGGASLFWPERWYDFSNIIPVNERNDLIKAYHKRLFNESKEIREKFASSWTVWENSLATMQNSNVPSNPPNDYALAFSRIENHYFSNKGFLERDNQIFSDMYKLEDIPGIIVQGRYDMVCPPITAFKIHKAWGKSKLIFADCSGHAMSEPNVTNALLKATDDFKNYISAASLQP